MFHLAGTDLFKYDAKLSHICQTVALPELKRLAKTAESKEGAPTLNPPDAAATELVSLAGKM